MTEVITLSLLAFLAYLREQSERAREINGYKNQIFI